MTSLKTFFIIDFNKITILLTLVLLYSCDGNNNSSTGNTISDTLKIYQKETDTVFIESNNVNEKEGSEYYILERIPDWLVASDVMKGLKIKDQFVFDNRMNPLYLEADFNGDGDLDIAIPIKNIDSQKVGFAIIHGKTNEIHIIAAGKKVKNALSDDMNYIDIWKINRNEINEAGLEENTGTGTKGELILKNPSLQIEKSELGGGLIYWDGMEYAYFHQTC